MRDAVAKPTDWMVDRTAVGRAAHVRQSHKDSVMITNQGAESGGATGLNLNCQVLFAHGIGNGFGDLDKLGHYRGVPNVVWDLLNWK